MKKDADNKKEAGYKILLALQKWSKIRKEVL